MTAERLALSGPIRLKCTQVGDIMPTDLPIFRILPQLCASLRKTMNAVLAAEPGSGKTTRVPLALLEEEWLAGRKIVMLEPRRIAAKSAARYMASLLGEKVGQTIGYRVRMDTKVSAQTRLEVVTEGVLARMFHEDPALEQVGLIIFDEFHERSIHADLGMALALEVQEVLRPELRIIAMSATLDARAVSGLLGDAPVWVAEGRAYPVETRHIGAPGSLGTFEPRKLADTVAGAVRQALQESEGDLLVFLPGAGEIRRVESLLASLPSGQFAIAPLYGNLPMDKQDQALQIDPAGRRKIVLSTAIAESSLTVDGVRVVIDCGWSRVSRFNSRTGMDRLETVRVSAAAAKQRQGRAGRLAPGVGYKLWHEQDEPYLPSADEPEIKEADLSGLALELAAWGEQDPGRLRWLDPPPAHAYKQARALLQQLEAIGEDGMITPHGLQMSRLAAHPRLAHMIARAIPLGQGPAACLLAGLASGRDVLGTGARSRSADLRLRLDAVRKHLLRPGAGALPAGDYDGAAAEQAVVEAGKLCQAAGVDARHLAAPWAPSLAGLLLSFAYPDRIAKRRMNGKFLLANGTGAELAADDPLGVSGFLVASELDGQGVDAKIWLAAPVQEEDLERHHAIQTVNKVYWDAEAKAVRAREQWQLSAIIMREEPLKNPEAGQVSEALLEGIRKEGLALLPWDKAASQLRERMAFMQTTGGDWPNVSDEALLEQLELWLLPFAGGMKSAGDMQRLKMRDALLSLLDWEQQRQLEAYAPTHLTVPSGSRIPVQYGLPGGPQLHVRLQEVFGWEATPRIAGGRVPVVMHLLSPAQRPVQVTADLASFWNKSYFEVKKDLKGRYPKHYWPDNPLEATATRRVRPQ